MTVNFVMRAAILCCVALLAACGQQVNEPEPGATISLRIETDGGAENFDNIQIQSASTVFDLMTSLRSDGRLAFEHSGDGAMVFIRSINGVANEGAGQRNWSVVHNGDCATQGVGAIYVSNGDRVVLRFADRDNACD